MADKNKMDADFKIRCFLEEKGLLRKQADEVGLSMSDYVRTLIFGKNKLVLLTEGSNIAKALFLIHSDLEYFRDNGSIPKESLEALTGALNDVSKQLNYVSAKLTDIHNNNQEADSNE